MALAAGLWLGGHPTLLPTGVRGAFVDKQTRVIAEAVDDVHDEYYRPISRADLADASIKGIVESLKDRFSNYFTPAEYSDFKQTQDSVFSGIGIDAAVYPAGLYVGHVYEDSPAKRAGMKTGDIITKVAGKSIKGLAFDKAVARIKGPSGSTVRLTFVHDHGATVTKNLVRATVSVPMVVSRLKRSGGKRVGIVALSQFGSGAHGEVDQALSDLEKRGATRFIFDLRHNGGGLVSEAQLIASAFLTSGVVVTTKGRAVATRTLRVVGRPVVPTQPVVVLVDGLTASASEIVTGALKDNDRAEVVGTRTFGKGVFQQVIDLSNGGALDITSGQYFTPSGHNLGGQGVKTGAGIAPDVYAKDNPKTPRVDEGLNAALRVVTRIKKKS